MVIVLFAPISQYAIGTSGTRPVPTSRNTLSDGERFRFWILFHVSIPAIIMLEGVTRRNPPKCLCIQ